MHLPPWPPLPPLLRAHLDAADPDHLAHDTVDDPMNPEPPRPWDLCALTGDLRTAVWTWLDDVATWINTTYGTHQHVIPACWPDHPAIAHDLAGLAFTRLDTYAATTAAYVSRWHTDLEDFHRRLTPPSAPTPPAPAATTNNNPPATPSTSPTVRSPSAVRYACRSPSPLFCPTC